MLAVNPRAETVVTKQGLIGLETLALAIHG